MGPIRRPEPSWRSSGTLCSKNPTLLPLPEHKTSLPQQLAVVLRLVLQQPEHR